jgi:hypothetical protein
MQCINFASLFLITIIRWCVRVFVPVYVQDLIGSCARSSIAELQREAIPEGLGGWTDISAQVSHLQTSAALKRSTLEHSHIKTTKSLPSST